MKYEQWTIATGNWIVATDEHLPDAGEKVLLLVVCDDEEEPLIVLGWVASAEPYRRLGLLEKDPDGDHVWCSDDSLFEGDPIEPPYYVVAWSPLPEVPEWLSTSIRIRKTL